nr:repeat element protein 8 [Hyposoter didymator ichnovirus]
MSLFEEESTSSRLSRAATRNGLHVPLDIILGMSEFLEFQDYHNFVRAFCPNGDEDEEVRAKLWQLSTHQVVTEFLSGVRIPVIYNFNPWRREDEPLLIKVKSLSRIFGGIGAKLIDQFASVSTLHAFIEDHVHMDECSNLKYASSCLCHLGSHESSLGRTDPESPAGSCPSGCFHHYCSQHLRYWLDVFLLPSIYSSPVFSSYR